MKILSSNDLHDAIQKLNVKHPEYKKWFIEKDYIISIVLKEIIEIDNSIIFKGGTSLSKMRKLIDRFSEDVDLSYCKILSNLEHKNHNKTIFNSLERLLKEKHPQFNFVIQKSDDSQTGYDLFKFEIAYSSCIDDKQHNNIKIEIYQEKDHVNAYEIISTNTLLNELDNSIFDEYEIKVMCLKEIFVDKLICICAIHNLDKKDHDSKKVRHLYDLIFLAKEIKFDDELKQIIDKAIKNERRNKPKLDSQFNVVDEIKTIIKTNYYETQYEENIKNMVYNQSQFKTYAEAIKNLQEILDFLSK